jgi:Ca2+-binding EF-hand superfamily protein
VTAEPNPTQGRGKGKGKGGGKGKKTGGGKTGGGKKLSAPKLVFSETFRRTRAEHGEGEDDTRALLAPSAAQNKASGSTASKGKMPGNTAGGKQVPSYLIADDEEITKLQGVADWDENGWISFAEARDSMQFDRLRFAAYDTDSDGRLVEAEFRDYYFDSLRRNGTFTAPLIMPDRSRPPPRTTEQLRNAYDRDLDERISLFELERLIQDYGRPDLEPEQLIVADDIDGDGRLALNELEGVVALLYPVSSTVTDETLIDSQPASLLELFRKLVPRETRAGIPPPPLIQGPVPPFHRLDLDNDGAIAEQDLRALLRPIPESVRIGAVLGILDLDGDGVLNDAEFERAMGGK